MFTNNYFPLRYFPKRYFPRLGISIIYRLDIEISDDDLTNYNTISKSNLLFLNNADPEIDIQTKNDLLNTTNNRENSQINRSVVGICVKINDNKKI